MKQATLIALVASILQVCVILVFMYTGSVNWDAENIAQLKQIQTVANIIQLLASCGLIYFFAILFKKQK